MQSLVITELEAVYSSTSDTYFEGAIFRNKIADYGGVVLADDHSDIISLL